MATLFIFLIELFFLFLLSIIYVEVDYNNNANLAKNFILVIISISFIKLIIWSYSLIKGLPFCNFIKQFYGCK